MKRQRGRGRKPSNPANRSYESNGPEVKIRGNASQIFDKYTQLARDASSAGDRVRAENLYQHAEHYFRIVQANQPKRDPVQEENAGDAPEAAGEDGQPQGEQQGGRERRGRGRGRRDRQERGERPEREGGDDPLNVVTPEGELPLEGGDAAAAEGDKPTEAGDGEDEAPRRRTRRPRRPRAEAGEGEAPSEAEAALQTASEASDDATGGGDDSESAAA